MLRGCLIPPLMLCWCSSLRRHLTFFFLISVDQLEDKTVNWCYFISSVISTCLIWKSRLVAFITERLCWVRISLFFFSVPTCKWTLINRAVHPTPPGHCENLPMTLESAKMSVVKQKPLRTTNSIFFSLFQICCMFSWKPKGTGLHNWCHCYGKCEMCA